MAGDKAVSKVGAVAETLGECVGSLREIGPARWEVSRSNGTDLRIEGRVEEDWVVLTARLVAGRGQPSGATVWRLLEVNGGLPGCVKLTQVPGEKKLLVGVELPLDEETDVGTRVSEACAGIEAAAALEPDFLKSWKLGANGLGAGASVSQSPEACGRGGCEQHADRPEADEPKAEMWEEDWQGVGAQEAERRDNEEQQSRGSWALRELCAEAGWECTERRGGGLLVNLEVPGSFHQAMLERTARGQVVLATQLAACDGTTPRLCRHALGLLLLRACAVIRMARAAAHISGAEAAPRFEVVFDSAPCASELRHALCALSAACRLCGQEAEVLQADERVAREYVAMWAWLSRTARRGERGKGNPSLQQLNAG